MPTFLYPELTNNQQKLLLEIQTFNIFQGKMPTVDQLKGLIRISCERLNAELNKMFKLGILDAANDDLDKLRLLRNSTVKVDGEWMDRLPMIGEKTAGLRNVHPRQLKNEFLHFTQSNPNELYFAKDTSDGYIGISQNDWTPWYGDVLIVRQQLFEEDGDVVVALFNEELIVRQLCMSENYPTLLAQNRQCLSIEISPNVSFRILGKVVARHTPRRKKRFVRIY